MKPYEPRPITFLGITTVENWRLKYYTLRTADSPPVAQALVDSTLPVLRDHLTSDRLPVMSAGTDWSNLKSYGVGFAMIHLGSDAVFLLCDYWVGENMINHCVWVSSLKGEPAWQSIDSSGVSVCVWELAVQAHEREAWIKHVYNAQAVPNFDRYLEDSLTAVI